MLLSFKKLNNKIKLNYSFSFSSGPLNKYNNYILKNIIKKDNNQIITLQILQTLFNNLLEYSKENSINNSENSNKNLKENNKNMNNNLNIFNLKSYLWFSDQENEENKKKLPKGVYIYGGVGCGKTFMMDLFYEELPIKRKLRVHFNTFMLDIHKRLYKLKTLNRKTNDESHLEKIANDIIDESYVICFDEFQVTDIADALLLKSLFTILWQKGCVVVATSNRPPSDLYKNGLQRVLFLPFIDTVLNNMEVVSMESSPIDYRQLKHSTDHSQVIFIYF